MSFFLHGLFLFLTFLFFFLCLHSFVFTFLLLVLVLPVTSGQIKAHDAQEQDLVVSPDLVVVGGPQSHSRMVVPVVMPVTTHEGGIICHFLVILTMFDSAIVLSYL